MSRNFISASLALFAFVGCASARVEPDRRAAAEEQPPDYRLGPEDVIEVSVWRNDELTRTLPVRPDGMISLPLINDLPAKGLTPMELRQRIAEKLAAFLPGLEVSVIVREIHSVKVSVEGEVVRPGRFELRGPTTVLDILAHAGGLTPFASRSQIVVLRQRGAATERIQLDRDRMLAGRGEENLMLRSGDLVFVP